MNRLYQNTSEYSNGEHYFDPNCLKEVRKIATITMGRNYEFLTIFFKSKFWFVFDIFDVIFNKYHHNDLIITKILVFWRKIYWFLIKTYKKKRRFQTKKLFDQKCIISVHSEGCNNLSENSLWTSFKLRTFDQNNVKYQWKFLLKTMHSGWLGPKSGINLANWLHFFFQLLFKTLYQINFLFTIK